MADKQTMTLNLSDREGAALAKMASEMDISKTAVMRSALRLFQLVHVRLQQGETFSFSGDRQRIVEFVGPGFGEPTSASSVGTDERSEGVNP